jgi:ferredoxin-NADP reductase
LCGPVGARDHWAIAIKREGRGRGGSISLIDNVHEGDELAVRGGDNLFPLDTEARTHILIAGGIGITQLRALLEVLPARRGDLALLYRGPSKESLVLRTEVDRIAEMRGAKVSYMLGSRDKYAFRDDPLSPAGLWASYPDIRDRDVYLCGSPSMMSAVEESLKELGVPKRQVHLERFYW